MRPTAAANWSYKHIYTYFDIFSDFFPYFIYLVIHFAAYLFVYHLVEEYLGETPGLLYWCWWWVWWGGGLFCFVLFNLTPSLLWIFPSRKKLFSLNTTIWLSVKVLIGAFIYSAELNSTVILHRTSANSVFFLLKACAGGVSTGYSVYKSLMKWLWLFSFAHTFELLRATHS